MIYTEEEGHDKRTACSSDQSERGCCGEYAAVMAAEQGVHCEACKEVLVLRSRPVKIPEEWNTKLNKYNKFMDEHYKATGCEPSAIRIRAFTHLDEEDVAKLKEIERMRQIGSLDAPIVGAEDSTLSELVASDQDLEGDVIERFDREQAYASLRESIEKLPDNEQAVLYT